MRSMRWAGLLALLSLFSLASPAFAAMQAKQVEWKQGKQRFSGFLVYNDATTTKRPGLMMVPDWKGVTPAAVENAKQIASAGYVVLVADVYGKGVRPKDDKAARAQVTKLYENLPGLRARAAAALDALRDQAKNAPIDIARIGAIGFCFGGKTVLELARSGADVAGVVSFHGGLDTTMPAQSGGLKASVLALNGADDTYVPAEQIQGFQNEMKGAGADWQFVNFSGAVHCFALESANSPPNCVYNALAAKRAYTMMNQFFYERFGN